MSKSKSEIFADAAAAHMEMAALWCSTVLGIFIAYFF